MRESGPGGTSVQVVVHVVIWAFDLLACPGLSLKVQVIKTRQGIYSD